MYTYILIDDEELIRKGTRKKISPLNDIVECVGEAGNGEEGIELIRKKQPDFVILDMQMPVMGGMELLPLLSEQYPSMPLIVISGYKDFDYIKQAISANAVEYLLKPFSAQMIQNCIHQVIERLEERNQIHQQLKLTEEETEQARYEYDITLLRNLIYGYRTTKKTLTSRRLNYINTTHDLILFNLCYQDSFDDDALSSWLSENGFGDLALYLSGKDSHLNQGFIILFLSQQEEYYQRKISAQILQALTGYLDSQYPSALVGVSSIHHSLDDLSTAYAEASEALDQRELKDHSRRIFHFQNKMIPDLLQWEYTEEFLFRIEAGMTDRLPDLCDKLFSFYRTVPSCTLAQAKAHCSFLGTKCRDLLIEYMQTPGYTNQSGTMENAASHIFTLENLKDYYAQFFTTVSTMLKPHSVYRSEDVIENIKIYIQKNYQKNLTQDFLASLFFLNRSYLSSLFRSRTGEKFVDYLSDIRIEHAEELLQNPDQKMYQIAKAVGYDNDKYFFRIFKKRIGMTPEQYRKKL